MTNEVPRMVRVLTDSFESVDRPSCVEDAERARLYERAYQAIAAIPGKIDRGESVAFEVNVVIYVMRLFGGAPADNVRGMAATLGASLGVKLPALAA